MRRRGSQSGAEGEVPQPGQYFCPHCKAPVTATPDEAAMSAPPSWEKSP